MAFRLFRRIRIAPGITVNLSKSGASLSLGPRGAKFTVGPRGARATAGVPGTGMFYTKRLGKKNRSRRASSPPEKEEMESPEIPLEDRLTLGFFKRLITPEKERSFVDGCRELALGNETAAFNHFRQAVGFADGAYVAGFLALKREKFSQAVMYFQKALAKERTLGRYFGKYGISPVLSLAVTQEIAVHPGTDRRALLLGLVEAYQGRREWTKALECLEKLRQLEPDDPVILLSLVELMMSAKPLKKAACQKVARLTKDVRNESEIGAALLLYKGRALRALGLNDAARQAVTLGLRRKKDRTPELLHALRYERASIHEAAGDARRARADWEKLYAEAPDYRDAARKLGM